VLSLAQHPDEQRAYHPIFLGVYQQLGQPARLRRGPQLLDPGRPLELPERRT
jgi:hypothetical protein